MISLKAGEIRDKRGGTSVCRPREGSDTRTSSSEHKDAQERQKAHGGKGNKHEGLTATKARQHTGTDNTRVIHHCCVTFLFHKSLNAHYYCSPSLDEDILPYSRPQFPTVNSPRDPSSSSSMSSRGSGGRRRGEGGRKNPADIGLSTTGAFQPGDEEREVLLSKICMGQSCHLETPTTYLAQFSTMRSDLFVSVLIAGVLSCFFTQMVES